MSEKELMEMYERHRRGEIRSGLSYLLFYIGGVLLAAEAGAVVPAILMTAGLVGGLYYGVVHWRAKVAEFNLLRKKLRR